MLSHTRAICAAIVAAATLIIAANAGPARADTAEPVPGGIRVTVEYAEQWSTPSSGRR
ncbi:MULTISPECIES: hypothetical protein [Streptomyces]|uniref:Uncharacterized protein n=1 Tax=Streptomyces sp. NBC_00093 TaxID=2975649 RepID=A0AAU2A3Y4_9ACTN